MELGLSNTDAEALVLLHELGHETGLLGDDSPAAGESGRQASDAFNLKILINCFGLKKAN